PPHPPRARNWRGRRSGPRAWRAAAGRRTPRARRRRSGRRGRGGFSYGLLAEAAEAPLAAAEILQRASEIGAVEVGPHLRGEDELGVGALPQQEVRESLLAAGADQQVDVGQQLAVRDGGAGRVVDGDAQGERRAA